MGDEAQRRVGPLPQPDLEQPLGAARHPQLAGPRARPDDEVGGAVGDPARRDEAPPAAEHLRPGPGPGLLGGEGRLAHPDRSGPAQGAPHQRGSGPARRCLGLDDVAAYPEPVEDAPTFEGNALLKARAGAAATGLATIADDSGLCVDALNGMPGVLSARWAGVVDADTATKDAANNRLLLAQLADVPDGRRAAHFTCAVVLAVPAGDDVREAAVEGTMAGRVIRETRGSGGFGYDVLFCADGYDVTTAELPREEKDAISHRGRALRAIAPLVAAALG